MLKETDFQTREFQGLRGVLHQFFARYFKDHEGELLPRGIYPSILREIEGVLIAETLKHTGGNYLEASRVLGIHRNTLREKIKKCDLE